MIRGFQEFLNEGSKMKTIDRKLALIALKFLCDEGYLLSRDFYLSQEDRSQISRETGRLPRGFAGPESGFGTGDLLVAALYNPPIEYNKIPYFDDADLVFGDWPLVFKCKVENRQLASTWKDLGEWLKDEFETTDGFPLKRWLESKEDYDTFVQQNRGRIEGHKIGLLESNFESLGLGEPKQCAPGVFFDGDDKILQSFEDDSAGIALHVAKALRLDKGEMWFGNDEFVVSGVTKSGKTIYVEQDGEFDMYGGPYDPKMKRPMIEVDGVDIVDSVLSHLDDLHGKPIGFAARRGKADSNNHDIIAYVEDWGHLIDKSKTFHSAKRIGLL